jgi:Lipocalin-like domain
MTRQTQISDILGTWELIDWKSYKDGNFYAFPMGEGSLGQLIYTDAGIMSGFLMEADYHTVPAKSDTQAAKCLSYAGHFHIEGDEVYHNVTLATISEWIGTPLIRTMQWQGENLLLTTKPEKAGNGHQYHNELLWKRREPVL